MPALVFTLISTPGKRDTAIQAFSKHLHEMNERLQLTGQPHRSRISCFKNALNTTVDSDATFRMIHLCLFSR